MWGGEGVTFHSSTLLKIKQAPDSVWIGRYYACYVKKTDTDCCPYCCPFVGSQIHLTVGKEKEIEKTETQRKGGH